MINRNAPYNAWIVQEPNGPFQSTELNLPSLAPGQVLVRIAASGLNPLDTKIRAGQAAHARQPLPAVLGLDMAGTVVETASGVTAFHEGDEVYGLVGGVGGHQGTLAEYITVNADLLALKPRNLSMRQAAALPLSTITAWEGLVDRAQVHAGQTVLIHAGAGGVGLLLTQMAKRIGARVITTVSTEEKAELSREAGASDVILYTEKEFEPEVKRLTGGKGVDVVYDSVGKTTFEGSLNCLRPRGLVALFGASSGPVPPFDLIQLSGKGSLFVTRPTLWHYIGTRAELEWRAGDVLGWAASGELKLRTEFLYPLAEAAQAQIDLEARRTTGKILLEP